MDLSVLLGLVPAKYLVFVAAGMGAAAALDAWLPQPTPGSFWVWPRKVLSVLGQNYGHAENLVKPGSVR